MEQRTAGKRKGMWVLKALLAAYMLTAILLVVLAMLVYKFEWREAYVSAAIVAVYVVSTFFGGVILGKLVKNRRFFWGMLLGILYFVLLFVITLGVYRSMNRDLMHVATTFVLCAGGGMTGGIIS